MLKRITAATLVATALMFSGCGSASSEGSELLALEQAQDSGDATAISQGISFILNGRDLNTSLQSISQADKLTLASSYMALSGFSMIDIIAIVSIDDQNASADKMETFKANVLANSGENALENVTNAIACYDSFDAAAAPSLAIDQSSVPELSEATFRKVFAVLIKAILLLSDTTTTNQDLADFMNNDVFGYFQTNTELDFIKESMEELKVNIANNAGADTSVVFDSSEYGNNSSVYDSVIIEASDLQVYR